MQSNQFVGRSVYAPPGIPPERLATLRDAFEKTVRDAEFLARMKAQRLEVDAASGACLHREIEHTTENAEAAARDLSHRLYVYIVSHAATCHSPNGRLSQARVPVAV